MKKARCEASVKYVPAAWFHRKQLKSSAKEQKLALHNSILIYWVLNVFWAWFMQAFHNAFYVIHAYNQRKIPVLVWTSATSDFPFSLCDVQACGKVQITKCRHWELNHMEAYQGRVQPGHPRWPNNPFSRIKHSVSPCNWGSSIVQWDICFLCVVWVWVVKTGLIMATVLCTKTIIKKKLVIFFFKRKDDKSATKIQIITNTFSKNNISKYKYYRCISIN